LRSQRSRWDWRFLRFFSQWSQPASTSNRKEASMLYLTGVLTVAALFYLAYVMIFPEKF
jgi:F subunit of K+-transporting ATPase (Potass_KdpF)